MRKEKNESVCSRICFASICCSVAALLQLLHALLQQQNLFALVSVALVCGLLELQQSMQQLQQSCNSVAVVSTLL
jgi:hypothetical protein